MGLLLCTRELESQLLYHSGVAGGGTVGKPVVHCLLYDTKTVGPEVLVHRCIVPLEALPQSPKDLLGSPG